LGLPESQTLIDSGGKFWILAPELAAETLADLQAAIALRLFETHGDSLRFHLAVAPMAPTASFGGVQAAWNAAMHHMRRRPLGSLLARDATRLFEAATGPSSGEGIRCSVTGELLSPADAPPKNHEFDPEKPPIYLCPTAEQQLAWGRALKGAKAWAVTDSRPAEAGWMEVAGLGIWHRLLRHPEEMEAAKATAWLYRELNPQGANGHDGFTWYGGAKFPSVHAPGEDRDGDPLTFDELAAPDATDAEGAGLERLGYLRMDVDSLGEGLRRNVHSWARYLAVSRSLDLFFKGRLEALRNQAAYAERVLVVYAGGDDIFAVGRWVELVDFAQAIRQQFQAYNGGNAQPSISGGMILMGSHFPIAKAAVMAGAAEDAAKAHGPADRPKNSFCLLDFPLQWEGEFTQVLALKAQLLGFLEGGWLDRSILMKLQRHYAQAQTPHEDMDDDAREKADRLAIGVNWTAVWDLVRYKESLQKRFHKEKTPEANAAMQFIDKQITNIYNSNNEAEDRSLAFRALTARLAELEIRSRSSELVRFTETQYND
jgi:CRISPR-associated protein Csm1